MKKCSAHITHSEVQEEKIATLEAQVSSLTQELTLTKQALTQNYDQLQSIYFWAETTDNVNRATTPEVIYETVLLGMQQVFNTPHIAISRLDETDTLRWKAHNQLSSAYLEKMAGYSPWPSLHSAAEPLVVPEVFDAKLPAKIQEKQQVFHAENFHTLVWLPILQNQQCTGQLSIFYSQVTTLDDALVPLAQILLNSMVFALERIQSETYLQKTLQELHQTQMQLVQSEKMSGLGQLVAGVAHEINNPVNFIYANLDPLNDYVQGLLGLAKLYERHYPQPIDEISTFIKCIDLDFLAEDVLKLLASSKIGAERIRDIVKSLRTFSRLDEAEQKTVDIHEGLDSTLMILNHRLKVTDQYHDIHINKAYGELPLVTCYPGLLNQVFMNIISNAIEALEMEQRHSRKTLFPVITIQTQTIESQMVQIAIADNGPGMSDEVMTKIFDPFFTTKAVGKGTGLGMSISYQIITETHGGHLTCTSTVGKGSQFLIEIPISA